MDQEGLYALVVLLIEQNGGVVELTQEEVESLDMEGKVLAMVPDLEKNVMRITVENEEDVQDGFVESEEASS